MEYTRLGKSVISVSRLCMGCMGFGNPQSGMHSWTVDEHSSREIIKRGLDLGINYFDTAIAYQGGTSEQFLGRALKDFSKRDETVIATKFLPRTSDQIKANIDAKTHINSSLSKSLRNLSVDYVDVYIYHMWDYNTPVEDIMLALNDTVKSGKVREIGISNCFAWQIAKANAFAEKEGLKKFISVQGHYNLIFREEEREMIPYCKEEGIALTPYSALASGRLVKDRQATSDRLEKDSFAKSKYGAMEKQDSIIIDRVAEIAEKNSLTRTQVALGWLLSKVTSPVVGATRMNHIEDAAKAIGVTLTDDEIRYLEEAYVPHELVGVMKRV